MPGIRHRNSWEAVARNGVESEADREARSRSRIIQISLRL